MKTINFKTSTKGLKLNMIATEGLDENPKRHSGSFKSQLNL